MAVESYHGNRGHISCWSGEDAFSLFLVSYTKKSMVPFRAYVTIVTALAGGKTKGKRRRFGYVRSLKYNLVVMLGAKINVVEAPI